MVMKTNFRSKVFKYAWQIVRNTGKTFSIALIKAWKLYKLRKRMANEVVKFVFEKSDGSLRYAFGTLKNTSSLVKGTRKENFKSVAYFDIDKQGFRSLKVENLIAIY